MDSILVDGHQLGLDRAREADVAALVTLLSDDELGAARESSELAPYLEAFHDIDQDPHQLLLVVRDQKGEVVGTCNSR